MDLNEQNFAWLQTDWSISLFVSHFYEQRKHPLTSKIRFIQIYPVLQVLPFFKHLNFFGAGGILVILKVNCHSHMTSTQWTGIRQFEPSKRLPVNCSLVVRRHQAPRCLLLKLHNILYICAVNNRSKITVQIWPNRESWIQDEYSKTPQTRA